MNSWRGDDHFNDQQSGMCTHGGTAVGKDADRPSIIPAWRIHEST